MKLRHLRNLRYKTGLTIVHLVSSLPVTLPQFSGLDYFKSNIHIPQIGIATHQCHNEEATAEARKHIFFLDNAALVVTTGEDRA